MAEGCWVPGSVQGRTEGRSGTLCCFAQKAGSDAVEAMQQSLQATSEGVRLRAACAILDYSMKGAELLDMEARIAALEGTAK